MTSQTAASTNGVNGLNGVCRRDMNLHWMLTLKRLYEDPDKGMQHPSCGVLCFLHLHGRQGSQAQSQCVLMVLCMLRLLI